MRTKERMAGFRDAGRRTGRDGAGSASLQSLKTMTYNKYQASEVVGWGEDISVTK